MFELVSDALFNSAKLVVFSLAVMVPISILGGLVAAYKKDTWIDRVIVNVGVALSAIPDFVAGVFLLAFLAVPIEFFKVQGSAPAGAGVLQQMQHLLLPVMAVLLVYFGYIARVTRAGTINSLDSDYARTAFMRGLPTTTVFRKHIAETPSSPPWRCSAPSSATCSGAWSHWKSCSAIRASATSSSERSSAPTTRSCERVSSSWRSST